MRLVRKLEIAAAVDELLGLDVELDLADATPSELQIRALGAQPFIHLVGMNLPLDRVNVGNGGVVEVAAPDEGVKFA